MFGEFRDSRRSESANSENRCKMFDPPLDLRAAVEIRTVVGSAVGSFCQLRFADGAFLRKMVDFRFFRASASIDADNYRDDIARFSDVDEVADPKIESADFSGVVEACARNG